MASQVQTEAQHLCGPVCMCQGSPDLVGLHQKALCTADMLESVKLSTASTAVVSTEAPAPAATYFLHVVSV